MRDMLNQADGPQMTLGEVEQPLQGPFTAQRSGMCGYEIADSDGRIAIWAVGEEMAARLVRVLNQTEAVAMEE